MARQELCHECGQKDGCQSIYEKLGDRQGPSVVPEVLLAFVAPIVVFIIFLGAFESVMGQAFAGDAWSSVAGLLTALAGSWGFVLILRAARRKVAAKKG